MDVVFDPGDGRKAIAGGAGWASYSVDGGQSWTRAAGISDGVRVSLAYAPSNPEVVFASVGTGTGALYRSTDGGQSYRLVHNTTPYFNTGGGRWANSIWVDPTNPKVVVVGGV